MSLDPAERPSTPTTDAEGPPGISRDVRGRPGPSGARGTWEFVVAACSLAIAYTLFTGHIWEDYFITFRHSLNLCEGNGLVFTVGERVHGFTSPLGVLLPALCHLATGQGTYEPALWLFRAISIAAYAGAGVVLPRALRLDGDGHRPEGVFLGLLYLLHVTLLDYSINGMETGFMALFVAWGLSLAARGLPERWASTGFCWGALMWTRPDGFVYIAALTAAALVFPRAPRKALLVATIKAATVCAIVYIPWFAWAWSYYGTPIPHTIVAKSNLEGGLETQIAIVLKETIDRYFTTAAMCFQPVYYPQFGQARDWYPGLILASNVLGIFSSCYWLVPVKERLGRMASLCFALLCFYFTAMPIRFPWYFPPAAMLGLVAVVRGVWTLAEEIRHRSPRSRTFAYVLLSGLCLERAVFFGLTAIEMRIQQDEIEDKTRTRVGLWLKHHVRPGERVYLECLGYIGYFSEARMADWPGLVTPEVVRLREEEKCDFVSIVDYLKPEWIVLRPVELAVMPRSEEFRDHYTLAATFDARSRLGQYSWIPGRGYLEFDSVFAIYKRMTPGEQEAPRVSRTTGP